MKYNWIKMAAQSFTATALIIAINSCTIDELEDLNAPSVEGIEGDASVSELNNVVSGTLHGMRLDFDFYMDDCAIIGRDYYRFSSADPRFTADIPGAGNAILDNNTFYITRPWGTFYQVVRNAWILRHAVENTTAPITQEEKNGYLGFAKTIQALEMIWISNLTYTNPDGCIRTDVEDPDNLGPLVSYDEALSFIAGLLDEAYNDLQNAGPTFTAALSTGFTGFDTPETFAQFNRAIKARVDVYQSNWQGALDDLALSFYSPTGDLNTQCAIAYSTAGGDIPNNLFKPIPNTPTDARVAVDFWVHDAEPGDLRLSKVVQRPDTATSGELFSTYDVALWSSQDDDVAIIRNEELILIGAEAKIQLGDLTGAVADLNIIRQAAGLPVYGGAVDQPSLTDEMLNQRRYSLFGEGHRWVDMRRYGRLGDIQTQNEDEDVWEFFPIPAVDLF